jgi:hypothetical protein
LATPWVWYILPVKPRSFSVFCGSAAGVPEPATSTASGLADMIFSAWPVTEVSVRA